MSKTAAMRFFSFYLALLFYSVAATYWIQQLHISPPPNRDPCLAFAHLGWTEFGWALFLLLHACSAAALPTAKQSDIHQLHSCDASLRGKGHAQMRPVSSESKRAPQMLATTYVAVYKNQTEGQSQTANASRNQTASKAQTWQIDQAQSVASFQVSVVGFLKRSGSFADFSGEMKRTSSGKFSVQVVLRTASVQMKRKADAELLVGPDYFDATRFPEIRFISADFASKVLRQGGDIKGVLQLRGQERPEVFQLKPINCAANQSGQTQQVEQPDDLPACLFQVTGNVNRSAYGMTARRAFVSDVVRLDFLIAAKR